VKERGAGGGVCGWRTGKIGKSSKKRKISEARSKDEAELKRVKYKPGRQFSGES